MNSPIVITSLNPYARQIQQLRSFAAWQALGVRITSLNVAEEAERLVELGVPRDRITVIPEDQSGQALHGSRVPLVLPALKGLLRRAGTVPVMLINSDLYPAIRNADALYHWVSLAGAVGLTREECAAPEVHSFAAQQPYRGGVDAFVFSGARLGQIMDQLSDCAAADRMAFGIPGWDYLMAALILGEDVGGRIMDSGVLLHEAHKTTYGNIAEFGHYLPDMARLAGLDGGDPAEVASRFGERIDAECRSHEGDRDLTRALFYRTPDDLPVPQENARSIARSVMAQAPYLDWLLREPAIAALASRDLTAPPDFQRALNLFAVNRDPQFRFTQYLTAIHYCLLCLDASASDRALTSKYPPNSLHTDMVRQIMVETADQPWQRRLAICDLFGAELVTHGIFNMRLYNFLAESCETDGERDILAAIRTTLSRSLPNVA